MAKATKAASIGGDITNDGAEHLQAPYIARVRVEGTSAMLFHRWSNEDVAEKAKAAKNSKAKKTDNVESYVWRDEKDYLCVPGEYFRQSIIEAARYRQDPRSPRKSARDLYKASIVALTELAHIEKDGKATKSWDYLDQRRVVIQRNAVTRVRPAFLVGWQAELEFQILLPEYVIPADFLEVLVQAGRLVGVSNFRPTYGRFQVIKFETSGI